LRQPGRRGPAQGPGLLPGVHQPLRPGSRQGWRRRTPVEEHRRDVAPDGRTKGPRAREPAHAEGAGRAAAQTGGGEEGRRWHDGKEHRKTIKSADWRFVRFFWNLAERRLSNQAYQAGQRGGRTMSRWSSLMAAAAIVALPATVLAQAKGKAAPA